jgi:hypothetical protein
MSYRIHWGVKLTTHLHLVPKSRMVELYLHSPISLRGVVLNEFNTRKTSPFILPHLLQCVVNTSQVIQWQ